MALRRTRFHARPEDCLKALVRSSSCAVGTTLILSKKSLAPSTALHVSLSEGLPSTRPCVGLRLAQSWNFPERRARWHALSAGRVQGTRFSNQKQRASDEDHVVVRGVPNQFQGIFQSGSDVQ